MGHGREGHTKKVAAQKGEVMKTPIELAKISRDINKIIIDTGLNYYEALGVLEVVKTYHQGALITRHKQQGVLGFFVEP